MGEKLEPVLGTYEITAWKVSSEKNDGQK